MNVKMSTSWRVIINPKLWNYEEFVNEWKTLGEEEKMIPQSKGKCIMKKCPIKNDIVYFVIKGKIKMEGIVVSETFEVGEEHKNNKNNIRIERPHEIVNEFVWIKIIRVDLNIPIKHMGQRTWVKFNVER